MKLLNEGVAVGPCISPLPPATHEARFYFKSGLHADEWTLLGSITGPWVDQRFQRRVLRLDSRLQYLFGWENVSRNLVQLVEPMWERKTMTDFQRFKRKMGMVLRQYETEKQRAESGELGIPALAMHNLNTELELAWDKARSIYGFTKDEYYNGEGHPPTLVATKSTNR